MTTSALIALGGNLGDRARILETALRALDDSPGIRLRAASRYFETPPVGGPPGQGPFLNAAATLETDSTAPDLLAHLQRIEADAGRVRSVRWGERTLDLDLLLFGDTILRSPDLTLPHPRMALRRFVLAPADEIAPDRIDPETGRTIRDLLRNLDRRPGVISFSRAIGSLADFPELTRSIADALTSEGEPDWIIGGPDLEPTFRVEVDRIGPVPRAIPTIHVEGLTSDPAMRVANARRIAAEVLDACRATRSGAVSAISRRVAGP